jgi:hypothetical protein
LGSPSPGSPSRASRSQSPVAFTLLSLVPFQLADRDLRPVRQFRYRLPMLAFRWRRWPQANSRSFGPRPRSRRVRPGRAHPRRRWSSSHLALRLAAGARRRRRLARPPPLGGPEVAIGGRADAALGPAPPLAPSRSRARPAAPPPGPAVTRRGSCSGRRSRRHLRASPAARGAAARPAPAGGAEAGGAAPSGSKSIGFALLETVATRATRSLEATARPAPDPGGPGHHQHVR